MDESKRTKILAAALVGVLGFMFIRPDRALMRPITEAQSDLQNANKRFDTAYEKQGEVVRARKRISEGKAVSLPPKISDAQRLYQSWITNLSEQCKFAQLKVTPGRTENRPGQYLTVNVDVEAETDLEGLSKFLFLFEKADLMHRVSSLDIASTGSQDNPRMEITLTAEGMSVDKSPVKSDVFPRTLIAAPITEKSTEIKVAESADFPQKTPFLVQIGREMVEVETVDGGTWTVKRGLLNTVSVAHPADQNVFLFPVAEVRQSSEFTDYENFLAASPFTKPKPDRVYKPRLAISDKTIGPGEAVKIAAKAEDLNTSVGAAVFSLENAAEGMAINAETGEFEWTPAADLEPKTYEATVVLTQNNDESLRVEKKLAITILLPNADPKIEVPASAVVVLGRDFSTTVSATDDGAADKLKFSFDGEPPAGLTIDGSGVLNWTPPKTFTPGDYTVTVKVTDSGTPAKSASGPITLKVQDDMAILTRFTGAVGLDGVPVAWFWNQAENKRPEVKVGERLTASDIDVEVTEISKRHILLADAEGIWRLRLGENLRQRELIEPVSKPEAVEQPATGEEAAEQQAPAASPTTDSLPAEATPAGVEPAATAPATAAPAEATPVEVTPAAEPESAPVVAPTASASST
ncbi:MAG: putative Ig domain-containing protein [Fuerstiella sp.]